LYLEVNGIERRATKVGSPHTDGFAGCFNRAVLDEFFRPALKRKPYDSVEALQTGLNLWLKLYNEERSPLPDTPFLPWGKKRNISNRHRFPVKFPCDIPMNEC